MTTGEMGCPFMRHVGCGILAVVVGIPGLLFLGSITLGAIFLPVAGALMLAPFVVAYSALWGPLLRRRAPRGLAEGAARRDSAPSAGGTP